MSPEPLVIVTGGSRGIGAALLRQVPFAARRISVSHASPPGAAGCEEARADLATPEGWRAVAELFERELPRHAGAPLWCWHNAGTLDPIGFAGEVPPDAYRRSVLLGAAAPQVIGDAFLRALRGTVGSEAISSGAARNAYEGWSSYCAGKAALDHWVRTVGREQVRRGGRCRVLAIAPGVVATAMQEQIRTTPEHDFPTVEHFVELEREGALRDPDDAARALWQVARRDDLANGSVVDLRDLDGTR